MIDLQGKAPKILVIGDLMIDHYLWGTCDRISPEAPVQVINVQRESSVLGGAGNVINNLYALGAQVSVMSVVGDCEICDELKALLADIEVNTNHLITQKNRITSKKSRIIASQQQVVRYDRESTDEISHESQNLLLKSFKNLVASYDAILLSDYGKGVLTFELTQSLITIANKNGKKVLIDPKGLDYSKYKGAYLLTPNKKEASESLATHINNDESLAYVIKKLKIDCDLQVSLITLSEQGVAIYDDELRIHPTKAREVFDVTGAGDTVLASLGFSLACGYEIDDAVQFSNLAAGVVVGKIGSATATLNEIIEYESSLNKSSSDTHIKTHDEIIILSAELKSKGKKIIFTNGCFDLLHAGHVRYLETAKSFGDVLILGLNSDQSVTTLKGAGRPINTQSDRAYILAALEAVDYVVIFDEETPYNLIKAIQPHILVKGGDYEGKKVVGQDIADELKLVQFVEGKSTTKTIKKIQQRKE
ncbi:D-glycero-beta-D-manno-heptose 1-phosphate adenylyltransferase (EC 2.7.7.70) / D-glycero-beta-D-manno-heptose-7-phosphate kinase (EC 2.7.1.167) [uncultured Gammaproteobacteria bacterium]|uniref:D-glycero-beta-D-manno-heptose-7-phosphate kinase n=1 Tax=Bathymodiolus heckerae thiotrophic gill symbiont TaxID=1052212 RepID=UPI0010B29E2A|nr:D-glycero-beta-D-manno-heptose-7-phosphate kinase [Bathymodiolus heckerae thiotrophic gill symbiont]CAC9439614.1 D-glycero-beta-D-manno-heptose 1-phosphate adenylyltransferase (EC 2.7.7.70) / D-glycero-beta-D-manno-heptose-7-phosphate kinase (EC 2.7.1.167) [uncultured Gammaproteobacteria bacterium]SMN13428.1 ADP-heptose synthase / D-glycero-beta-D-manno-heptose 7-phosphate kinase [Bathymodiolus heckerae thiotrophic gill symbiont]SMN16773.1 ADP-heptose synthase / D-glycero-beta-D-manno-heptose